MTEIDDEDILTIPKNMETLSLPSSPKSNEPFFGYNSILSSVNKSSSPTKSHLSPSVEPFNPTQRSNTSELKGSPDSDGQPVFNSVFMPPPPLPISNVTRNNSFNNLAGSDDISTIFVVGFPDDMTEREFQNMFIFSSEFEAATLKIPAKEVLPPPHKDPYTLANIPATGIMSERENSSTIDESVNLNITAAQQLSARKQTIGFAKFRTKQAALDAKDVLSGRKIDGERGSVLKAEMAKKNLHTRSKNAENTMQSSQSQEGIRVNQPTSNSLNSQNSNSSLLGSSNSAWDGPRSSAVFEAFHNATSSPTTASICSPNQETLFRPFDTDPTPPSSAFDPFQSSKFTLSPSHSQSRTQERSNSSTLSPLNNFDGYSPTLYNNNQVRPLSPRSSLDPNSNSAFVSQSLGRRLSALALGHNLAGSQEISNNPSSSHIGLALNDVQVTKSSPPSQSTNIQSLHSQLQQQSSHHVNSLAPLKPTNPADQNPPCSTLYVGNLTTPPPSQPVSLLEDALRALFSKQGGFKRLSFRQKANGPMCFVEFEDVQLATKTLHDLYGNTLNGLIRGGIRLSYSKNPLGVRSNPTPSSQQPTHLHQQAQSTR
ncbi:hypothetical protein E3Q22_02188 [Wallemia mellicola]|uniref:RRM domain-containing protein n=2 Tax=Wallemia mellicola TaxID=1708541 RepID=A0A4T0MB90_9BASI|nr:hypothetical protein WALSEDRAFT_61284 [Wallemia mellicola CBS 633.66]TIB72030.1 hypothetical protein E3Q24_01989 [Wallemia mellicola]EIM19789.1 hypothetical protein WALSEDRAFT_61284 [Wallemia mellicola CBS 633.66]TIB80027.1 hypothetical protein E3Q22_02188 [Wallemia mellicola]TIB91980.1 hypothetical protein E3Q19_02148 [Wallemia mellicola]TIC00550.1 hypothetical protein E3Q17_02180 [Wallemia mellicola]|eukprot:XP_006960123.1 hypothetical protein WALSEDRAFT_61284 [Wallemia mellicola CBS 633.66]